MEALTQVVAGMLGELRRACSSELALLEAKLPEMPAAAPSIYFPRALELLEERRLPRRARPGA